MVEKNQVMEALRSVLDPELGINIVDLGLIYDVETEGGRVNVRMTLTAPGCPMHSFIAQLAQAAVEKIDGVEQATVQVVWDPPWTPERMSEAARTQLGWL